MPQDKLPVNLYPAASYDYDKEKILANSLDKYIFLETASGQLKKKGISTVGQACEMSYSELRSLIGPFAASLFQLQMNIQGITLKPDSNPVKPVIGDRPKCIR